jgi:two-component system NtrC family sensor kinase
MEKQDIINIGDFDREYNLADLLPVPQVRDLLAEISRHLPLAIILPDGRTYCDLSNGICRAPAAGGLSRTPHEHELPATPSAKDRVGHFPLRHEMEDIGYLVIAEKKETAGFSWDSLGPFIARAVNQIIHMMYKNRMTAGLHVQVVEDSYRQLEEKAAGLARSEEKYRKLSENLEAEVARKSEKIKAAQLMLLQQEKLASIGQLAAGMAHEINNPIGFIISNLSTLAANVRDVAQLMGRFRQLARICESCDGDESAAIAMREEAAGLDRLSRRLDIDFMVEDMPALISECLDGAGRIGTIVGNLRDFAHPSVDALETVDINHCLDTTLSILGGQITPGIIIRKHYLDIPRVCCHLREMNQVFFHILRNALQAAGTKGTVSIGTQPADGGTVNVVITDTGPGIDEAHLPHLFEPFFTTRQVGSGIGLGLHLAHSIVKKHGGGIDVESKPGGGSTFRVRIPVNGPPGVSKAA